MKVGLSKKKNSDVRFAYKITILDPSLSLCVSYCVGFCHFFYLLLLFLLLSGIFQTFKKKNPEKTRPKLRVRADTELLQGIYRTILQ